MSHWLRPKRVLGAGVLTSVLLGTLSMPVLSGMLATPVAQAAGTITGTAFRDFNDNGVKDTNEVGQNGVTVTAYDASNTVQGTATTAANGTYSLAATGTGPYRIEFSSWPSYVQPAAQGTSNATSVQFVPDGNATANFALNDPNDYSQANPLLASPSQRNGLAAGDTAAGVNSWSYSQTTGTPTNDADIQEVGSTWGEAWQRTTKRLFVSAFAKRHAGFGPRQADGIYVLDYTTTPATVVGGFNLQGVTPANGGSAIDLGTVDRTTTTPAGDYTLGPPTSANRDIDAFAKVGEVSYGDIDMSEDGQMLWLVNLNQAALVSVDVSNYTPSTANPVVPTGQVNQYALSSVPGTPSCVNGVFRPFGLKFAHGQGYLGGVCDAATSASPITSDLRAYVLSFNPQNVSAGFTTVVTFPLNYTRESNNTATQRSFDDSRWHAWIATWPTALFGTTGKRVEYAQPMLSDIEFTDNGSMVLGFSDRFGHQSGSGSYPAVSGSNELFGSNSAGDIVQVCNVNGSFVLEGQAGCPSNDQGTTNAGSLTNDGPSNAGEYYWQDNFTNGGDHPEITMGALAHRAGVGEIVSTVFDPTSNTFTQGARAFNTQNGTTVRGFQVVGNAGTATFGKASGMGDIELLSDLAPVEIGNRVWLDPNHNGIQDANEPAVAGVTVHLYAPNGTTILGTAVTDANGNYYFSNATGTSTTSAIYGITGMTFNTTGFQIRLDNPANYAVGGPLYQYTLTTPNVQTGDSDVSGDIADSDGTLADPAAAIGTGNFPTKTFNVGAAGFNNHTYDFGFFQPPPTITLRKLVNGADANDPNGTDVPIIAPGQIATWTYVVTNTGTVNIPRADISVTDDVVGSLMTNGVLQPLADPYTGTVFGSVDQLSPDNVLSPGEVFQLIVTWRVPDFSTQNPAASATDQWVLGCGNGSTNAANQRVAYENTGTVTIPGQSVSDDAHLCNPPAPTAITLQAFTATRSATGVTLAWTTTSEVDTLGFHLLRSTDGTLAHATRVTTSMILAHGRGTGASYTWTDTAAPTGAISYWLEETDTAGAIHRYGPATTSGITTNAAARFHVFVPVIQR